MNRQQKRQRASEQLEFLRQERAPAAVTATPAPKTKRKAAAKRKSAPAAGRRRR